MALRKIIIFLHFRYSKPLKNLRINDGIVEEDNEDETNTETSKNNLLEDIKIMKSPKITKFLHNEHFSDYTPSLSAKSESSPNFVKVWRISLRHNYEACFADEIIATKSKYLTLFTFLCLDFDKNEGYHNLVINANPKDFYIRISNK